MRLCPTQPKHGSLASMDGWGERGSLSLRERSRHRKSVLAVLLIMGRAHSAESASGSRRGSWKDEHHHPSHPLCPPKRGNHRCRWPLCASVVDRGGSAGCRGSSGYHSMNQGAMMGDSILKHASDYPHAMPGALPVYAVTPMVQQGLVAGGDQPCRPGIPGGLS